MAQAPGGPRSDKGVYILDQLEKPPGWLQGLYWFLCAMWLLGGIGYAIAAANPAEGGYPMQFNLGLSIVHILMAVMLVLRREQFMNWAKIVCWICLALTAAGGLCIVPLAFLAFPVGLLILFVWLLSLGWYYGQIRVIDAMENYGMF